MSFKEARKTALDHLKERPDYYSVAEKAGLEEEGVDEVQTDFPGLKGGRLKRLKGKKGIPVGASSFDQGNH